MDFISLSPQSPQLPGFSPSAFDPFHHRRILAVGVVAGPEGRPPKTECFVKSHGAPIAHPNLEKRLFHSHASTSRQHMVQQLGRHLPTAKCGGRGDIKDMQFPAYEPGTDKSGEMVIPTPKVDTGYRVSSSARNCFSDQGWVWQARSTLRTSSRSAKTIG